MAAIGLKSTLLSDAFQRPTIGNTFGARPSATYACTLGTVCHNASTPYFESNIGLSAPTVAMLNVAPGMLRGS